MNKIHSVGRAAAAVGCTIALLAASNGSASAASGSLKYKRADTGTENLISSPVSNECIQLQVGAVEVANGTDATAFLYALLSARAGTTSSVGAIWSANIAPAHAVRFNAPS
ncbi:hypothetical protein [Streptomyces sp. NBC_01185]|uniref:hypothetical protein n=1 Tax=Streptomyces sp. NBC_01185 TaxID=2903764 RepID=UPI00386B3E12|nr:hypothetical protein OG770_00220 [Streptomyces sp. NBC_01185]